MVRPTVDSVAMSRGCGTARGRAIAERATQQLPQTERDSPPLIGWKAEEGARPRPALGAQRSHHRVRSAFLSPWSHVACPRGVTYCLSSIFVLYPEAVAPQRLRRMGEVGTRRALVRWRK